jgi:3-hydroxy acid dehydrogenase/malonic semialdehyde reductase
MQLRELGSPRVEVRALDVSDRAKIERFCRESAPVLQNVRVLINNAGLALGLNTLQEGNLDDWDRMIDTNLRGLLVMTRLVLPYLQDRRDSHIVNLGSVAGHSVYPKGGIYCATKFAVRALTEALRLDLLGTGIRVTEISPGMVETEFSQVRLGDAKRAKAVYSGMTPLSADDIAETIEWCLNRPRHVNIQEVVIYPTDQASPTNVHRRSPQT